MQDNKKVDTLHKDEQSVVEHVLVPEVIVSETNVETNRTLDRVAWVQKYLPEMRKSIAQCKPYFKGVQEEFERIYALSQTWKKRKDWIENISGGVLTIQLIGLIGMGFWFESFMHYFFAVGASILLAGGVFLASMGLKKLVLKKNNQQFRAQIGQNPAMSASKMEIQNAILSDLKAWRLGGEVTLLTLVAKGMGVKNASIIGQALLRCATKIPHSEHWSFDWYRFRSGWGLDHEATAFVEHLIQNLLNKEIVDRQKVVVTVEEFATMLQVWGWFLSYYRNTPEKPNSIESFIDCLRQEEHPRPEEALASVFAQKQREVPSAPPIQEAHAVLSTQPTAEDVMVASLYKSHAKPIEMKGVLSR